MPVDLSDAQGVGVVVCGQTDLVFSLAILYTRGDFHLDTLRLNLKARFRTSK